MSEAVRISYSLMIKKEEVYKIGILHKPHGIHGELQFSFTDDVFDRTEGEYIVCLIDGIFVPFFIEEYRFRSECTALLKLEGISDEKQASQFTNVEVYYPIQHGDEASEHSLSWNYFIGFAVEELSYGKVGLITDVDTSTINTLFVVDREGEEILLPAQEKFIVGMDQEHRAITMELPEGLLQLDELDVEN